MRIVDWLTSAFNHVTFYPQILGLFLLGAYFAKLRLLHDVRGHVAHSSNSHGGQVVPDCSLRSPEPAMPDFAYIAGGPIIGSVLRGRHRYSDGKSGLAAATHALCPRRAHGIYELHFAIGRLHTHLLQLRTRPVRPVGPLAATGIALAIYIVQIFVSRAWLARFRMGPLERLWRRLTYGRAAGATRV